MHEDTGGPTDPIPLPRPGAGAGSGQQHAHSPHSGDPHSGGPAESAAGPQLTVVLHTLPELYQYCWSLLGPGSVAEQSDQPPGARLSGACAAVWDTTLTAVDRHEDWTSSTEAPELRVWLFALARAACQRTGWGRDSPYASVTPTAAERVTATLMNQLAPSQRELLELTLRHGLSPGQVSAVVGLDTTTVTRLSDAAVVHSREIVATDGVELGDAETISDAEQLRGLLAELAPPHPPAQLETMIQLACTSPDHASARRAATNRLGPYGSTLLPQHRGPHPERAVPATEDRSSAAARATDGPHDRPARHTARTPVTTDVPPVRANHGSETPARRNWIVPAVAGLCTVMVALTVWTTATLFGGPRVVAAPPNDLPTVTSPTADTGTAVEGQQDADGAAPGQPQDEAPGDTASDPDSATETGDVAAEEPGHEATAPETESEPSTPGEAGSAPEAEGTAQPSVPGSPSTPPPADAEEPEGDDASEAGDADESDEERRGLLGGIADTMQGLLDRG